MATETVANAYMALMPKIDTESLNKATTSINSLAAGFGKAFAVAAGAAVVNAAVSIGKAAVEAYGEYEQLVGGVETLFKDSADVVQQYAAQAYQTAGLSANDYMETVTSFSASLLQSLGGDTAEAAKVADMAITDMADNANKMGTNMEAIQNAYQGFAKQNYTMLDNLKLGYGGTKTEMERLLADAEKLTGVKYDINSLSDVYEAIHAIQGELGITGTTAEEASTTIQGSVSSAKAAYENWLTALGDQNADLEEKTNELVASIETVVENMVPVVTQIIESLINSLPDIISKGIPLIAEVGFKLVTALIMNLPAIIENILTGIGDLIRALAEELKKPGTIAKMIDAGWQLLKGLAQGIVNGIASLIGAIPELFGGIVDGVKDFFGIHSPSTVFAQMGGYMMEGMEQGIIKSANKPVAALNSVNQQIAGVSFNATAGGLSGRAGITIQNMTVYAEDVLTADKFVSMVRQAAGAY